MISSIIFALFLWFMLTYWYPAPHFQINGGWQGIKIMLPIDFIIGPFLTFLLANPKKRKKELIFDLSLVAAIQISLLIYGMDKINSQRPIVQVVSHRGYIASARKEDLIYQAVVNPDKRIKALNIYNIHPPMVYSVFEDYLKKDNYNFFENKYSFKKDEKTKGNFSPELIVSRYRALNSLETQSDISHAAEKAAKRFETEPENQKPIEEYIAKHGDNFYFFPLHGAYGDAIIVLDKQGKPIDYFNVKLFKD